MSSFGWSVGLWCQVLIDWWACGVRFHLIGWLVSGFDWLVGWLGVSGFDWLVGWVCQVLIGLWYQILISWWVFSVRF